MTFFKGKHAPVLQLLAAIAAQYGCHLAQTPVIRSPLDVKLDHLAAELAELPTYRLVQRVSDMEVDAFRVDQKFQELCERYNKFEAGLMGISLPDVGSLIPQQLRSDQRWAEAALELGRVILGQRAVRGILDEIENPLQAESPARANPAA